METTYDYTAMPPYVMELVNDDVNNVVNAHHVAVEDILVDEGCVYCE